MLTVEEARKRILDTISVLPPEKRGILDCLGHVLAEDIYSVEHIPPFDNSAMDGFAVIAEDVQGASEKVQVNLPVIETIAAGYAPTKRLGKGQAARIMTGAMMPAGADAVVMQEVTQFDGEDVKIAEEVEKAENVRFTGESVKSGDCVMSSGKLLRPQECSMLASLNRSEVLVHRRPRVAVVSTGDELTPLGKALEPGKIRDSNRYGIYAQLQEAGCVPIDMGIARDDEAETERIFRDALSRADALITSGGVSVGEHDVVKTVFSKLGEIDFWRVAMKPGKPQAYGIADGKPIFGLPGILSLPLLWLNFLFARRSSKWRGIHIRCAQLSAPYWTKISLIEINEPTSCDQSLHNAKGSITQKRPGRRGRVFSIHLY